MTLKIFDPRKMAIRRRSGRNRPLLFDRHPGQALMIIAITMVVLLGFTALAIDGGELYFNQRQAQNAADAAVLSAVYELCQDPNLSDAERASNAIDAGELAAVENGFNPATDPNVRVTITVPADLDGAGPLVSSYNNVTVLIKVAKPGRFVQIVYTGTLEASAFTGARCAPAHQWAEGRSLFATSTCSPAIDFTGAEAAVVGGVHANGGINFGGGGQGNTVSGTSSAGSGFDPPGDSSKVDYEPDDTPATGVTITPPVLWDISKFAPGGDYAVVAASLGKYYSAAGNVNSWGDFSGSGHPKEGIYYAGGDITLGPSDFSGVTSADLQGVTIVAAGQIDISVTGSTTLIFGPPYDFPPPFDDDAGAYVLPSLFTTFGDGPNSCVNGAGNAAINTSGSFNFEGVIYAPNGSIYMSFPQGGSTNGAVIGSFVSLSGSDFSVSYDPELVPPIPPEIGVTN